MALIKYYEPRLVRTEPEALEKLINDNIMKHFNYNKMNQSVFRRNSYWNEKVDNILKAYKPLFWHIYKTFGGKACLPGESFYMINKELVYLVK